MASTSPGRANLAEALPATLLRLPEHAALAALGQPAALAPLGLAALTLRWARPNRPAARHAQVYASLTLPRRLWKTC